jgi:hypothetical protein
MIWNNILLSFSAGVHQAQKNSDTMFSLSDQDKGAVGVK